MARAIHRALWIQCALSTVFGAILGASLGVATAQDLPPGALDVDCSQLCVAKGYDKEFCGQVCWVPDPAMAARGSGLDWNCMSACRERGGRDEDCMASCRLR